MLKRSGTGFLRLLAALLPWGSALFFFWVFYERYARFEFNELGRHYDPQTQTVYTDAGFVWIIPALFFLLLAVCGLRRRLKSRR